MGVPPRPALPSPRPAGGDTEEEILRVDMLENQIMDFRMSLVMVCYNPDFVSVPELGGSGDQTHAGVHPGVYRHWGP